MSWRAFFLVFVVLIVTACNKPQGEWQVTQGFNYPDKKIPLVREGSTTAGEVITLLGVPYATQEDVFIYQVQYTRPVERTYLVYSEPYTERLTLRTWIKFEDGVVSLVESTRTEQLLPPE